MFDIPSLLPHNKLEPEDSYLLVDKDGWFYLGTEGSSVLERFREHLSLEEVLKLVTTTLLGNLIIPIYEKME